MSKLMDYLNTLDQSADAREAHKQDPKGAMQSFGLTDEEQAAVLSGDKQTMADAIGIPSDELHTLQIPESTF